MNALILITMYLLPGRWWRMLNIRKYLELRRATHAIIKNSVALLCWAYSAAVAAAVLATATMATELFC